MSVVFHPSCSCTSTSATEPSDAFVSWFHFASATELAAASSKAALSSAGVDPALIDATFVGNVIQSRCVECPTPDLLCLCRTDF